jgi:hypothetical protein
VRESERRSLSRRAARSRAPGRALGRTARIAIPASIAAVVIGAVAIDAPPAGEPGRAGALLDSAPAADRSRAADRAGAVTERRRRSERRAARKVPSAAALSAASRYALDRTGVVSLAAVNSEGKLRGTDLNRRYSAASVVKAMLLAAEVRRLKQAGAGIDSTTDSLLRAMITRSDNDAADAIYGRVGDAGLNRVARRSRMTRFTVAGHWGNAQIAAGDMARFFGDLDRALARRHRKYANGLLGSVVASQRWGIPQAAGERWAVRFKGGWLPDHALVHQAAELRERDGNRELSIAILTDEQPSHGYGVATVREVAARLLSSSGGG